VASQSQTGRVHWRVRLTLAKAARRIHIEPAITPRLKALFIEAKGAGSVFQEALRRRALVQAEALPDASRRDARGPLRERRDPQGDHLPLAPNKSLGDDLRATGITWMAARGDDPLRIMQRAGHEDFDTTQSYQREAENLSQGVRGGLSGAASGPSRPRYEFRHGFGFCHPRRSLTYRNYCQMSWS
jgi:integrase